MTASPEPLTLAEMHARKRAADERQAEAARRLVQKRLVEEARAERLRVQEEQERERQERELEQRHAEALERAAREYREQLDTLVHEILPPEVLQEEPKAIVRRVAEAHGLKHRDLVGPRVFAHIVKARHHAVATLAEARPDLSLKQLARHFGGRDHTTILHALRKMNGPGYRHRPHAKNGAQP